MADRTPRPDELHQSESAALVARLRAGDERALAVFVETYFDRIVGFVSAILGSYDAAQDVAQETFMRVWDVHATLDPARPIRPYLFALARTQAIDALRYRRVRERHQARVQTDAGYDPDLATAHSREDELLSAMTVEAALRELPERRQLAVRLRIEEQMTHAEIAQVLQISTQAAERLVQRALDDLRRLLQARGVSGSAPP